MLVILGLGWATVALFAVAARGNRGVIAVWHFKMKGRSRGVVADLMRAQSAELEWIVVPVEDPLLGDHDAVQIFHSVPD